MVVTGLPSLEICGLGPDVAAHEILRRAKAQDGDSGYQTADT